MTDPLLGQQLANFRIEHMLGQGGMARVYYGIDVKLKRPVAIKILDERLQANQAYARRFVREAQTFAAWRHENVLQVYYADETEGKSYFVAEYIDGADLGKLLDEYYRRGELIPHEDVLRVGRAIASALDFAHHQGVIHRDVKPANVFIERSGRVVLGDFGLALEVQQGTMGEVFGTPQYISPEQARHSAEAVPASDLYSLGVILYEMLTGAVPFDDPSPTTVALQHITLLPPPPREINPSLNEETEQVLLRALNKNPQERFQSGKNLMDALGNALSAPLSDPDHVTSTASLPDVHLEEPAQISELTALEIMAAITPPTAELPPNRPLEMHPSEAVKQAPPKKKLTRPLLLGCGAVLFILVIGGILIRQLGSFSLFEGETGQPRPTEAVVLKTDTIAFVTATNPQSHPAAASSPTATTVTDTSSVTASTATGTDTPVDTPAPTSDNLNASPTVKYPQGHHMRLYYNDNGIYLYSLAEERIAIEPIAFERLDGSSDFSNRFEGFEWAKLYAYIWPKNCLKAEIRDSRSFSEPSVCLGYNAARTFKRDEEVVFWTAHSGTTQFRVLWDEEEIARCEIDAGVCEIYLP